MSRAEKTSTGEARSNRFAAASIMLAWILGSMGLLLAFRGVPLRIRGMMILGSLVLLIAALGWMKLLRAARR